MKIQPLFDRVIIEKIIEDSVRPSGIIIPEQAKERPFVGMVIAAGPGKRNDDGNLVPMTLKEGDKVVFGKFAGSEVEIEGQKLLLLKEEDVFGVVRE